MKQGGKKGNKNGKLYKSARSFEAAKKPDFKYIEPTKKAQFLARPVVRRLIAYFLHHLPVRELDKAITRKTGRPNPKAAFSRGHAKGYNEGRHDERALWRSKGYWVDGNG